MRPIATHGTVVALIVLAPLVRAQGQGNAPIQPPALRNGALSGSQASAQTAALPADLQKKLATIHEITSTGSAGRLATAKAKVKANDLDGAEDVLTVYNNFSRDTAGWHMETSRHWVDLARNLAREKERSKEAATDRALQHLDAAATLAHQAGDVRSELAARLGAAFIQERFRGDPNAAIAAYKTALQIQPDDAVAKEQLARLESSLAILQARLSRQ